MTVKKCDRCKSEERVMSKFTENYIGTVLGTDSFGNDNEEVREIIRKYDLCDECAKKVGNWIIWGKME